MTYKGSNWTRGELGHAVERDPSIDCPNCGESHLYQDYWKPRYVDGREWNPAEIHWLCDECLDAARREYELHQRREQHAVLTEFDA